MKTILIIFLYVFPFNCAVFGQWQVLNAGLSGFPDDSEFIGSTGWIAAYTTLLKSDDGGETWNELPLGEDLELHKIDFVNEQNGWAYGYSRFLQNHVVAFTANGGESWQVKHVLENAYGRDIYAMTADTVFVLGSNFITRTTDGFENKTTSYLKTAMAEFYVFDFFDEAHGIAVAGTYGQENYSVFFKTSDNGISWEETDNRDINNIYTMRFAADSTAFFIARNDSGTILFCKTEDFFESWQVQSKSQSYTEYIIYPLSADTVYSVTSVYDESFSLKIEVSYDSGKNWLVLQELPFWGIKNIVFENGVGYITGTVGGGGFINQPYGPLVMRSTDTGQTWEIKTFTYPFRAVQFLDDLKGFAVGGSRDIHHQAGEVFMTGNGGRNWQVVETAGTEIAHIQFIDENTGFYLVGPWGQLFKTTDGGEHWIKIYENNYDSTGIVLTLFDFHFEDVNNGWMVGEKFDESGFAYILKTDNGGSTWQVEYQKANSSFKDIFMLDSQNGWAVGDKGLVVHMNNGQWQSQPAISDKFLNKVFFSDAAHGWISTGFESLWQYDNFLYKTSNGGQTWDEVEDFEYIITDIFFKDNNTGWMVGADTLLKGIILHTENSGQNWDILAEDLPAPLHAFTFNPNYSWAVGDRGLVMRSDDGITWIEEPVHGPADLILYPNYPNPFNPITNIEYSVWAYGHTPQRVKLAIYNLLGQKVATLVDRKQAAGRYKVQWDASGLAGGVYLIKLYSQNNLSQTGKMLLLK